MNNRKYNQLVQKHQKKIPLLHNASMSFIFGGIISLIGQVIIEFNRNILHLSTQNSRALMSITLVFLASILTGFNVYDKIGQYAHSGTVIPITGFANSMTSSAMEYRPEGFLLGISANMFKLAGSVIALGTLVGIVVAICRYIGTLI